MTHTLRNYSTKRPKKEWDILSLLKSPVTVATREKGDVTNLEGESSYVSHHVSHHVRNV